MAGWSDRFGGHDPRGHSGGGSRGGSFGDGPGRRRRLFDADQLRLVLIALIGEEPRHGYDLIKALGALSGGNYAPSPGMVYPQLAQLADEGLVAEAGEGGARRVYALTAEGEAVRQSNADEAAALLGKLRGMAEHFAPADAEPVRRAMHNLKHALIARLTKEGADKETMFSVVELIDEATRKIERL